MMLNFSMNFEPSFLAGLELVSTRSYTMSVQTTLTCICHCLQVQVWLSATFAMTLRGPRLNVIMTMFGSVPAFWCMICCYFIVKFKLMEICLGLLVF